MNKIKIHKILTVFIASIWIVNGLFCKILNLVPRHEEIVGRILGNSHSSSLTILIGIFETVMAIWILSGYKSKLNAILQITIIALMNTLEYILVPDLLLWGKFNILFAFLFIGLVYYTNFKHQKNHVSIT